MPDPTKQTISATQSPALFNVSPYVTRWMLWQHFFRGMELDSNEPDSRMLWGRKMQPLLLEQAAADLRLEVRPNEGDRYLRRGLLGCTRDATIICPDRGPGALETKCVFDYRTWMTDWGGGAFAPRHYEIQLQQQMLVADEEPSPFYEWGVIAAWVAGDMHYFEREAIGKLRTTLLLESEKFFREKDTEPEPFGAPVELPWLAELFPCTRGKELDLSENRALAEAAIQYRDAKEQEAAGARTAEPLRARLLAAAKDAENLILPDGLRVRVRPHGKGKRVTVFVPGSEVPSDLLMAG